MLTGPELGELLVKTGPRPRVFDLPDHVLGLFGLNRRGADHVRRRLCGASSRLSEKPKEAGPPTMWKKRGR